MTSDNRFQEKGLGHNSPGAESGAVLAQGDDLTPRQREYLDDLFPGLQKAAAQAAKWFREYEALHAAKGNLDGDVKARINAERAEYLETALERAALTSPPSVADQGSEGAVITQAMVLAGAEALLASGDQCDGPVLKIYSAVFAADNVLKAALAKTAPCPTAPQANSVNYGQEPSSNRPEGRVEAGDVADTIAYLRQSAQGMADATAMMADAKTARNRANGEPDALYTGLTKEQTREWKAADLLERLALSHPVEAAEIKITQLRTWTTEAGGIETGPAVPASQRSTSPSREGSE